MSFCATYFGSNGWLIEFKDLRILIDPWFSGDLVFPPGEWFFKGQLREEIVPPSDIDILLITQGLPDHCHRPTLLKLPKNIKVICSYSASKILLDLGFKDINVLRPSEKIESQNISVSATSGARVPNVENGYIVSHKDGSFYIEPHGFLDPSITPTIVDAVITPIVDLKLPLAGAFIKGKYILPKIIKTFSPSYILASTSGGDIDFSGFLNNLITYEETNKEEILELYEDINLISLKQLDRFSII
tara:strand:- start:12237 stop:12971 length:735 start_codon:yes stop_codon:yes gene_type:complete